MRFIRFAFIEGLKLGLMLGLVAISACIVFGFNINALWLWTCGFISSIVYDIVSRKFWSGGQTAHNNPMPFAPPIFEDGIAVVEGAYLPKRTIMASRDLYDKFKDLPNCSSKTAA